MRISTPITAISRNYSLRVNAVTCLLGIKAWYETGDRGLVYGPSAVYLPPIFMQRAEKNGMECRILVIFPYFCEQKSDLWKP